MDIKSKAQCFSLMVRVGNLIEKIASIENLELAFYKAQQGKLVKPEVALFMKKLYPNLQKLRKDILSGNVNVGNYHYFTIYDPKIRIICAASFSERVLHHAIMNVCHNIFEKFQIYDSYATRPGKGQYAALERAKIYNKSNNWYCKLDIRKYFDSINHDILYMRLKQKIKDKQLLLLLQKIISSYEVSPGKGIPIGNLTSQYFANYYLGFADHFIKEKLRVKSYLRYMDDMLIWDMGKESLKKKFRGFSDYIKTELCLELKEPVIQKVVQGVPFLGYILFPNYVRLNKNSKSRFLKKFNEYNLNFKKSIWTQQEYADHIKPLFAFANFANVKPILRQNVIYS